MSYELKLLSSLFVSYQPTTTWIMPNGRMAADHPEYYTADYLMVDVPIRDTWLTVYTRFGDWLGVLCLIATGVVAALLFGWWGYRRVTSIVLCRRAASGE